MVAPGTAVDRPWDVVRRGGTKEAQGAGLTLEQLAERSSLTFSYLSTVETDKRDPSLSTMRALASALGVPLGDLVEPVANISGQAQTVARLFEVAPPEVQHGVLLILGACAQAREEKPG
jgi:transcriptional regulator with XRE-family HTH domain